MLYHGYIGSITIVSKEGKPYLMSTVIFHNAIAHSPQEYPLWRWGKELVGIVQTCVLCVYISLQG
jgi:hypothetical protein